MKTVYMVHQNTTANYVQVKQICVDKYYIFELVTCFHIYQNRVKKNYHVNI